MPQRGNNNNNNNEIKTEDIVVQNPVIEEADQEVGEAGQEVNKADQEVGEAGQETGKVDQEVGEAGQETGKVDQEVGEAGQGTGKVDQEVGEAGQEANKAEQEDNQVDQDNPVIEDENEFYEEGHFLAPEEKTKLVDYTKIFEDQKKFAAMADDAKVALFKEYALLKAKSATYYRPSKEQQMLQELESSRKIVDKTFDLMVKNVKVGTNCLEELNQVYIMELCFGNTLLGRSDEEKEAILEEYEKERIESWRKREEKKRKREEEKKKAAEKASVGLIPQQRKIEPEQEQPKEEEKVPEKKEEQTREADNDPEDIGRKKFTIDDANKEGEEFYNGIKSVDFNLLGKGSPQFRAMKDSLKALSSRAKIDYHLNDGKLNLGAYCMAQEDAIKKMEDYLAYKEDQFDKDSARKEDPARQKREQPRIQKTIQILSKLKKSYEQNKALLAKAIQKRFVNKMMGQLNKHLTGLEKEKDYHKYREHVVGAVDIIADMDSRNLKIRENESVLDYKARIEGLEKKPRKKLVEKFAEQGKDYPNSAVIIEAIQRFKGGTFVSRDGQEKIYPGKERVDSTLIAKMLNVPNPGFSYKPKAYYTRELENTINASTKGYEDRMYSKKTIENIKKANEKAKEKAKEKEKKKDKERKKDRELKIEPLFPNDRFSGPSLHH